MNRRNRLTVALRSLREKAMSREQRHTGYTFADGDYSIRVANDRATRQKAYRLVYDLYRDKGYACTQQSGMWVTPFDLIPDTTTILVERKDGKAVGAITVVLDSPMGLPAEELYNHEIDKLRSSGRKIAEVISLAVSEDDRRSAMVLLKLFNFAYFVARGAHQATDCLVTVTPKHARLYSRLLLFSQVGEAHSFKKIGGTTGVLMRLNFDVAEEQRRTAGTPQARKSAYSRFRAVFEVPETVSQICSQLTPMTDAETELFSGCCDPHDPDAAHEHTPRKHKSNLSFCVKGSNS